MSLGYASQYVSGTLTAGLIITPSGPELTIASGAITVTSSIHPVDTEADAASDNLDTISGGVDGQHLWIHSVGMSRTVVVTESGNVWIGGGAGRTISLTDSDQWLHLIYFGVYSKWVAQSAPFGATVT